MESGLYNPTEKALLLHLTTRHCFDLYTQGGLADETEAELEERLLAVEQTSDYLRISTERYETPAEPTDAGWIALKAAGAHGLLVAEHRRMYNASSVEAMDGKGPTQTEMDEEDGWQSDAFRLTDTLKWWRGE